MINLHWIGRGTLSIADIARIQSPTVITMHDMWGFCGAEHLAPDGDDARWVHGYERGSRPAGHRGLDLDRWTWRRKRRLWREMTVVAPSRWMAGLVKRSSLMADWPVHVVSNPLDVNVFVPRNRPAARRHLKIPPEVKVILFGGFGGGLEPDKGFDLFVAALQTLTQLVAPSYRLQGALFGVSEGVSELPGTVPIDVRLRSFGTFTDDHTLALLYNAADVVVVASRQDNVPQVGVEAQAWGTPVVAFDTAGLPDVVVHNETGYLAEPFSVEDLAHGIRWVLEDETRSARLGRAARERAVRVWSSPIVAEQYRQLFEEAAGR